MAEMRLYSALDAFENKDAGLSPIPYEDVDGVFVGEVVDGQKVGVVLEVGRGVATLTAVGCQMAMVPLAGNIVEIHPLHAEVHGARALAPSVTDLTEGPTCGSTYRSFACSKPWPHEGERHHDERNGKVVAEWE